MSSSAIIIWLQFAVEVCHPKLFAVLSYICNGFDCLVCMFVCSYSNENLMLCSRLLLFCPRAVLSVHTRITRPVFMEEACKSGWCDSWRGCVCVIGTL